MKACTIYKTNKEYKVTTVYQRESEIFHEKDPVFMIPITISDLDFSHYIFKSLNSSGKIKDSELITSNQLLQLLKESSFKKLYKNSTCCMILLEKNKLEIIPYKNAYDGRGLVQVDEDKKTFNYSKENESIIIDSVIEILNHKY